MDRSTGGGTDRTDYPESGFVVSLNSFCLTCPEVNVPFFVSRRRRGNFGCTWRGPPCPRDRERESRGKVHCACRGQICPAAAKSGAGARSTSRRPSAIASRRTPIGNAVVLEPLAHSK